MLLNNDSSYEFIRKEDKMIKQNFDYIKNKYLKIFGYNEISNIFLRAHTNLLPIFGIYFSEKKKEDAKNILENIIKNNGDLYENLVKLAETYRYIKIDKYYYVDLVSDYMNRKMLSYKEDKTHEEKNVCK